MHCSRVSSVTVTTPFFSSPFRITISKVESAFLASPLAKLPIMASMSSEMLTFSLPKPLGSLRALCSKATNSSVVKACSTKTLHLDKRAPFTSKEGFSVVAPIRIMLPFSTKGKKASCCALLKR